MRFFGKYARRYLEKVQTLVGELAGTNGLINDFIKNFVLYDHAVSTSVVAGLLVNYIGIESKPMFEASGLAVLLHDIGLLNSSEAARSEDTTKMSQEDLQDFYLHPERGAKILSKIADVPKPVIQAVQQHHMRLGHQGFPKNTGRDKINRLAELIGLSDEFVGLIGRSQIDKTLNPLREMQNHVLKGFSEPVASVFRNVFILK